MDLPENIRNKRKENGMSQNELAEKLGISRQSVSLWEKGLAQPSLDNLMLLSQIFEVSLDELVGEKTEKSEPVTVDEKPQKKSSGLFKLFKILLIVASVQSILVGLLLWYPQMDDIPFSGTIRYSWRMYPAAIIPIASIVFGIVMKRKGYRAKANIVVGAVFLTLVLLYGSFWLFFSSVFQEGAEYIAGVESTLEIELPQCENSVLEDTTDSKQSTVNGDRIYYTCEAKLNESEKAELLKSIASSDKWMHGLPSTIEGMAPITQFKNPDYCIVYNETLGTFNELPDKSGTYKFIFISYDIQESSLEITEYGKTVTLP